MLKWILICFVVFFFLYHETLILSISTPFSIMHKTNSDPWTRIWGFSEIWYHAAEHTTGSWFNYSPSVTKWKPAGCIKCIGGLQRHPCNATFCTSLTEKNPNLLSQKDTFLQPNTYKSVVTIRKINTVEGQYRSNSKWTSRDRMVFQKKNKGAHPSLKL